jgi:hypothetical protein
VRFLRAKSPENQAVSQAPKGYLPVTGTLPKLGKAENKLRRRPFELIAQPSFHLINSSRVGFCNALSTR